MRQHAKSNKQQEAATYQRRGFSVARKGRGARLLGDSPSSGLARIWGSRNSLVFCRKPPSGGLASRAYSRGLFGPWHLALIWISVALSLLRCRFIGNHPFYPTKKVSFLVAAENWGSSDSELFKPKPKNPKPAIQKRGTTPM